MRGGPRITATNRNWSLIIVGLFLISACSGTLENMASNKNRLDECSNKPNCVNSQSSQQDHFIEPLMVSGSDVAVQEKIVAVLKKLERVTVTIVEDHYIRAEARSRLFRFVDDLEFYFPESSDRLTTVHVRSASRIGYSDLGVNRKRVERIRQLLEVSDG